MPELPEVETVRRGVAPHIIDNTIGKVIVRDRRLRWPVTPNIEKILRGKTVSAIDRRGKYLLLRFAEGTLLIHLGMSGRLCLVSAADAPKKHDHVDIPFTNGTILRFTDPRRFGAMLWIVGDPLQHSLLAKLGPEPLEKNFDARYLFKTARNKKLAIKNFIMETLNLIQLLQIQKHPKNQQAGTSTILPGSG